MNQFYKVTKLIENRLRSNPNCPTVIIPRNGDADLYKKNIYPMAIINPISSNPSVAISTSNFTYEIAVVDQRGISKDTDGDKIDGNDEYIDNLNITNAILTDLVGYLRSQNNDDYIEVVNITEASKIEDGENNRLDGWMLTIKLAIPNTQSFC